MGAPSDDRSDDDLLLAAREQPEAFAVFYRRHVRALAAYFWRRSGDAETTADLTAETFAAALAGCGRFDPARGPAIGWLYGIAHRQLGSLQRRGAVEQRARRRLGMARLQLDDEELERVEADAVLEGPQARVLSVLAELPDDQRMAVEARVLRELDYAQIASACGASEPVVRKRVSRGLATLRAIPPAVPAHVPRIRLDGIVVAVLNATTTAGVARGAADDLHRQGRRSPRSPAHRSRRSRAASFTTGRAPRPLGVGSRAYSASRASGRPAARTTISRRLPTWSCA